MLGGSGRHLITAYTNEENVEGNLWKRFVMSLLENKVQVGTSLQITLGNDLIQMLHVVCISVFLGELKNITNSTSAT